MMDETKNNPDDEVFEDDFDFDDLDEIGDDEPLDDLEDDDFEDVDFDEDDQDWDSFDEDDPAGDEQIAAATPKKKTFIQKNFNNIVIGIAVIVAIWIFLGQLSKDAPRPQSPAPTPAVVAENTEVVAPAVEEQAPSISQEEITAFEQELQSLSLDPSAVETTEKPDLFNIDAMPEPATQQPVEQNNVPTLENEPLTPMPDEIFATAESEPVTQEPVINEPIVESPVPDLAVETNINEMFTETLTEDVPVEDIATPVAETPIAPPVAPEPINVEASEEYQSLAEKNAALQAEINELERAIQNSQTELQRLNTENYSLQQKAETATQEAMEAQKALKVVEVEKAAVTPPQDPAPAPVVQARREPTPAAPKIAAPQRQKSYQWTLRSAQPGSAMIAEKGSNDLHNITVGDKIPGLGRIQSISVQNGRWVVQGSQNSVSQ